MALLDRLRNILLSPKTEWPVINGEQDTPASLLTKYIIPLLVLGSVAAFIGYGIVGVDAIFFKIKGFRWGAWFAIRHFMSGLIGFYVAAYVIDALAPNFSSEKNLNKSAQLVAYASTPSWVAALFMVLPELGFVGLIGLYGIYLFYIGLPVMKQTPDDKRIAYMVVAALVIIVVSFAVQWLIGLVLNPVLGDPYAGSLHDIRDILTQ